MSLRKSSGLLILIMIWPAVALLDGCCANHHCVYITDVSLHAFDNGGDDPIPVSDGRVRAQALMLEMRQMDSSTDGSTCGRFFHQLAPTVMACADFGQLATAVTSVQIFSDHALDSTTPAGSDLLLTRFKAVESSGGVSTRYYMNRGVTDTATHIFTVRAALSNGDTLTATTPPLLLVP